MANEPGVGQPAAATRTSSLQRLGVAVVGVPLGILAFAGLLLAAAVIVGSVVLLFWNEGHAIQRAQGLAEGAHIVRSVQPEDIDARNNGQLIHVVGNLTTEGPIADREFAVRSDGVRYLRHVEMYQWQEQVSQGRHSTGPRYIREWLSRPIDSARFREPSGHTNPEMPAFRSRELFAVTRLGDYDVSESLLRRFGHPRRLSATDTQASALRALVADKPVTLLDGALYAGNDPQVPAIGDIRVSFAEVLPQKASVVARQAGKYFEPFRTRNGTDVELIAPGDVRATAMFAVAEEHNVTETWRHRGIGVLGVLGGFLVVMRIASGVGALGGLKRTGALLVALLCTAVLAPMAIAFAWMWYRPLIGIGVLLVGGVAALVLIRLVRRHVAQATGAG